MIRWLIVVFLALILFNGLMPWLQKLGLRPAAGRFPLPPVRARVVHPADHDPPAERAGGAGVEDDLNGPQVGRP
jgi:hypothetical protein